MKKLKYLTVAALVASAGAVSIVACNDDDKTPEVTVNKDYPVFEKKAGKVIVVAHFLKNVCNNDGNAIIFPGSYLLADGTTDWITDPTDPGMLKFTPVGEKDGKTWTDWFYVEVPVSESSIVLNDAGEEIGKLGGKPVHLDEDLAFDWAYQSGDADHVKVLDGDVNVVAGYSGEANIYFTAEGVAYLEFDGWKNDANPCVVRPKHNYTFTATTPAVGGNLLATDTVYIAGAFNNWTPTAMTKGSGNTWTISYSDVKEGTEYDYILNRDWAKQAADENCIKVGNRVTPSTDAVSDVVVNWKGVTCVIPAGTGTFTVTITGGYVAGKSICIVGNFETNSWAFDATRVMTPKADNKFEWTGAYPAGFEYKVIMCDADGSNVAWATGDNANFDGNTYTAEFSF